MAIPSYLAKGGDRYEMIPKDLLHHKNIGILDKVKSIKLATSQLSHSPFGYLEASSLLPSSYLLAYGSIEVKL